MKEEKDLLEEHLGRLFRTARPDDFWVRQQNQILARLQTTHRPPVKAWVLGSAFALGFGFVVFLSVKQNPPPSIPPRQDWPMLERLELWQDLDTIEKMGRRTS